MIDLRNALSSKVTQWRLSRQYPSAYVTKWIHAIIDSHVGHDSFQHGTWLIHMCDTPHSYIPYVKTIPLHLSHAINSRNYWFTQSLTEWQKGTGCLIFRGLCLQKSPMILGSFSGKRPATYGMCASFPPCMSTQHPSTYVMKLIHAIVDAHNQAWELCDEYIHVGWLRLVGSIKL